MPKATSPSGPRPSGAPFQNAQVLRRNQACHQCRRRKLKCDAKRPCSTCVRSHAYAVAHATPGSEHLPHPECTFDDVSEPTVVEPQEPKNRFERLENRISELEALLREKDQALSSSGSPPSGTDSSPSATYDSSSLYFGFDDHLSFDIVMNTPLDMGQLSSGSSLDDLAGVAAMMGDTMSSLPSNDTNLVDFSDISLLNPSWPARLPDPPVVRHLVEAFFNFVPIAKRLFHAPTFLASLSLPPTHPKFPIPAVLHAVCAMGSMFMSAYPPIPGHAVPACSDSADSFADKQIRAAKSALAESLRTTADLFESLQARIIVALWYWYNARWSEACVSFAISLRYAVPCGLNVCPPFDSLSTSNMARSSVIPPAANAVEDEARRNTFWIAYICERHFTAINNFATLHDDEDVAQMLPVRGDQFEQGTLVPPRDRQWSFEDGIIEKHTDGQIDSFIFHVKTSMLLSKVKTFNTRYKVKRHKGDPDMQPNRHMYPGLDVPDFVPTSPAFIELDRICASILKTLPSDLKSPVTNGVIDELLLSAMSSVHFAIIILHEGHARIGSPSCVSSRKILAAARAILELLYEAYTTGHNLASLGVFPMVCWFASGRVLVRFLRAAIDAKSDEHISSLRTEIDIIRSVMTGIGDIMPHAYYYGKMLNDYLAHVCGKEYVQPVNPSPLPSRHDVSQYDELDRSHVADVVGQNATS